MRKYLKDYTPSNYSVKNFDLVVRIFKDYTTVDAEIDLIRVHNNTKELFLDGINLELLEISVDDYSICDQGITINNPQDHFTLKTSVKINPKENFSGDGFYIAGDILCTQCEAEGFRKITYFLDRPDVMTKYKVRLEADINDYPILLANGNRIDSGSLDDKRHFCTWEDPFKKPSYLFAMVAGDLALKKDTYKTMNGRVIDLEVYVEPKDIDQVQWSLESLKNSMKWDEQKWGLEYDLDLYMVLAVDSFNMGAMENKGLNIFNTKYALAHPELATDQDFINVEAVIGHEYFHNWTGNRVTCRDWFQLTLKEGLTVFRDQEFTSDMQDRSIKRIEDVRHLKALQYPEDQGPLSHPIKPKSYIEMNNFYTLTVYEKGSEVIRMIHTILGPDNFRKGMDLYFQRHDGQAVTTEDFVSSMSDASGIDLEQFKVWYDQNGTPVVDVLTDYNSKNKTFTLKLSQKTNLNNDDFDSLHIPIKFSLYNIDGSKIELKDDLIHFKRDSQEFSFSDIDSKPILSLNNDHSAPVIFNHKQSEDELNFLALHDKNNFSKSDIIFNFVCDFIINFDKKTDNQRKAALNIIDSIINSKEYSNAFKSLCLTVPSEKILNNKLDKYRIEEIARNRKEYKTFIYNNFKDQFISTINELAFVDFELNSKAFGDRSLVATIFSYLDELNSTLINQVYALKSMTLKIAALQHNNEANSLFVEKYSKYPLLMQKFLSIQAMKAQSVDNIKSLMSEDYYDEKNPNFISSVLGVFSSSNLTVFNTKEGLDFYLDEILKIDKFNSSIAAKLLKGLSHIEKLDLRLCEHVKAKLSSIKSEVSADSKEIISLYVV